MADPSARERERMDPPEMGPVAEDGKGDPGHRAGPRRWVLCVGSDVTCSASPPPIGTRNTWKKPSLARSM